MKRTSQEIENILRSLKPTLSKKYYVDRIGYFGSYTDDSQSETSDLDIIVEFSRPVGWEFLSLEAYLESQFGIKIDLVTPNALKKRLNKQILDQVIYV